MKGRGFIRVAFAGFILFFTNGAWALPITYDEAVSGDLATLPSLTLNLGVGVNTVSGTTGAGLSLASGSFIDGDSFFFTLPGGTRLVGISSVYSLDNKGASMPKLGIDLRSPDLGTTFGSDFMDFAGVSPDSLFASLLPLGAGSYAWLDHAIYCGCAPGTSWSGAYTISLSVVPEPESLWLVGAGLALLLLRKKPLSSQLASIS